MNKHRKLQQIQTKILSDVHNICEKENLTYYMIGGTLLGAVRHKGFIPWDDDIDLVMYRDDYNKLIRIINEQYGDKYFVQTFSTDPHYTRYIAKIRLNGTKQVESYLEKSESHNGIYIDIFPLDYISKTDSIGLRFRGWLVRMMFAYKSVKHKALSSDNWLKKLGAKILYFFTLLIPDKCVNKLFDYVCSKENDNKNCKYTTNFASHFKWKKQLYENDVFGDGCLLEFEGYMFKAPNNYQVILERLYGENYMQLPPIEKQETHNLVEIDFGSYEDL